MGEPKDTRNGVQRIADERKRQVEKEGWTPDHDDEHWNGELGLAAASYASPVLLFTREQRGDSVTFSDAWPSDWDGQWDKRHVVRGVLQDNEDAPLAKRIRMLEKAGALIAAEIDRLCRTTPSPKDGS